MLLSAAAIVSVCCTTTLVSCSKDSDDDDPIVNPGVQKINVFCGLISPSYFDFYDIKLTVKNATKQKELTLKATDCKSATSGTHTVYSLVIDSVDGVQGVTSITADVTPKANIEDLLNALDPDEKIYFLSGSQMVKADYSASGNYVNADSGISAFSGNHTPVELLSEVKGDLLYKNLARTLAHSLTAD